MLIDSMTMMDDSDVSDVVMEEDVFPVSADAGDVVVNQADGFTYVYQNAEWKKIGPATITGIIDTIGGYECVLVAKRRAFVTVSPSYMVPGTSDMNDDNTDQYISKTALDSLNVDGARMIITSNDRSEYIITKPMSVLQANTTQMHPSHKPDTLDFGIENLLWWEASGGPSWGNGADYDVIGADSAPGRIYKFGHWMFESWPTVFTSDWNHIYSGSDVWFYHNSLPTYFWMTTS